MDSLVRWRYRGMIQDLHLVHKEQLIQTYFWENDSGEEMVTIHFFGKRNRYMKPEYIGERIYPVAAVTLDVISEDFKTLHGNFIDQVSQDCLIDALTTFTAFRKARTQIESMVSDYGYACTFQNFTVIVRDHHVCVGTITLDTTNSFGFAANQWVLQVSTLLSHYQEYANGILTIAGKINSCRNRYWSCKVKDKIDGHLLCISSADRLWHSKISISFSPVWSETLLRKIRKFYHSCLSGNEHMRLMEENV